MNSIASKNQFVCVKVFVIRMSNLSRRLPPLGTLVVFESAFRLRSFSRAADEVARSQASVSRQIGQLEDNLGVKLFIRQRYDVMPTPEGEKLASTVHLALRELAYIAEQLRTIGSGRNSLVIFSDISIASSLITPVISAFQQQHPNLQIRVLSSYERIQDIHEHFDIGFQVGRIAEDLFEIESFADDIIFPVCSPGFAANLPNPINAVDIAKQPLLHLEELGYGWPDWRNFLAHFRLKEPKPIEGLMFNSYQVCLDVAEKGEGIALGWARSVKSKIDEGKLVRIPGMTMSIPESIFIYKRKLAEPNPIVDQFIHMLRNNIEPIN
ncbi:MAG: LysR substrate-binding domain-containing protein [bacterium]